MRRPSYDIFAPKDSRVATTSINMALRTAAVTIAKRVALAAGPQVRVTGHKCCGIFFGAAPDLLGALKAVVLSMREGGNAPCQRWWGGSGSLEGAS